MQFIKWRVIVGKLIIHFMRVRPGYKWSFAMRKWCETCWGLVWGVCHHWSDFKLGNHLVADLFKLIFTWGCKGKVSTPSRNCLYPNENETFWTSKAWLSIQNNFPFFSSSKKFLDTIYGQSSTWSMNFLNIIPNEVFLIINSSTQLPYNPPGCYNFFQAVNLYSQKW